MGIVNSKGRRPVILICFFFYCITALLCLALYHIGGMREPVAAAFWLDIFGTLIIFFVSMVFDNTSIYDPYWSLAPVPILVFWAVTGNGRFSRQVLIIALVCIWGARLTYNCFRRWTELAHEDWRYAAFRRFTRGYWLISLFGLHMMPTLVVFLACLAVYPALAGSSAPLGPMDAAAFLVTGSAIFIEALSDDQLRKFIASNPAKGSFITGGLWKWSRHPNYFGEILFWVGLSLFSMRPGAFHWWVLPGPIAMLLLFKFVSVPMMDRRMKSRYPGYDAHMEETHALLPLAKIPFFATKTASVDKEKQ